MNKYFELTSLLFLGFIVVAIQLRKKHFDLNKTSTLFC